MPWKIDSYYVSNNVLSIVFMHDGVAIDKGGDLKIENALLFEAFGDIPSNWMTIRVPPFVKNYNFESKIGNPVYDHTF